MKYSTSFFFLTILTIQTFFCNAAHSTIYDSIPDYQNLNQRKLESAIKFELSGKNQNADTKSIFIKHWYESHNFHTIWLQKPISTLKTDTLLSFISHIDVHGLKPDQLDYSNITALRDELNGKKLSYLQLANFDIKVSNMYLQYCAGLKYGFINPKIIGNYNIPVQKADSVFIATCFNAEKTNLLNFLSRIQPKTKTYLTLQAEKDNYKSLIDSTFTPIPLLANDQTIKLGTRHASIPLIARRLMITGELPYDPNYRTSYQAFNLRLLKALNAFRNKTRLSIDEEIGNSTINALNKPFAEYVNKINVNLERLRWVPSSSPGKKYIRVNVADMTLNAYKNDTVALKMKVCVGRPKNMTPLLQSKIFELVINPTWTVPNSIVIKEIAKIASRDISYFERCHIHVYLQGEEIDPSTVDWTKITINHQPYKLVQASGRSNSLGRIKFNFKSPYSVYLHDTNTKRTFKFQDRAVSHGCIRVEKPLELVNFCFPDLNPQDKSRIQKNDLLKDKIRYSLDLNVLSKTGKDSLKSNPKSMRIKRVWLKPYIPIILDYQTCLVNASGKIQFRDDIYKLDSLLNMQLIRFHQN
ncbi:MAG: L,D-transpeptidase family protein [Bacteroidota bacterium]|nr:L,D-transpeptidase family protein [Bacteroidota bacterium]